MVLKIRKSLTLETQPPGVVSCLELLVVEIQISRLVYPQLGRSVVGRIGVRIACGFLNMSSVSSTATKIDPGLCFVLICNNRRNL